MSASSGSKRIYLAAALIIASGAGIGLLLRPSPPPVDAAADASADKPEKPKTQYANYSGPNLRSLLPPSLNAAAAGRPDCFYMHVAYVNSLKPGSSAGNPAQLRKAGADAGCWIGD